VQPLDAGRRGSGGQVGDEDRRPTSSPRSGGTATAATQPCRTASSSILAAAQGRRGLAGHALVGAGAASGTSTTASGRTALAIPAGTCPSVGIGGHALGGGFGLASRAWGLASDNVLAVQM